jgi:hypothetical protein
MVSFNILPASENGSFRTHTTTYVDYSELGQLRGANSEDHIECAHRLNDEFPSGNRIRKIASIVHAESGSESRLGRFQALQTSILRDLKLEVAKQPLTIRAKGMSVLLYCQCIESYTDMVVCWLLAVLQPPAIKFARASSADVKNGTFSMQNVQTPAILRSFAVIDCIFNCDYVKPYMVVSHLSFQKCRGYIERILTLPLSFKATPSCIRKQGNLLTRELGTSSG